MAQAQPAQLDAVPAADPQAMQQSLWRRWFGHGNGTIAAGEMPHDARGSLETEDEPRPGIIRRVSRKVVPGLPRAQTFKRQQAEVRNNLEPVQPTPAERRALSVDRRLQTSQNITSHPTNPRTSAPDFIRHDGFSSTVSAPSIAGSVLEEKMLGSIGELTMPEGVIDELPQPLQMPGFDDAASMTTSQYDNMIHVELERIWILNLSMHFRDKSKREKFFVTYREKEMHWRRVTISLDYRGAPENSLEMDLLHTKFQRDKSAKIYEAIRESLVDIQFYETITNLKLQTTDGRLHVHVVEDVNEIIHYPTVRMIQHLRCRHVRECDIGFEAHMSGFVYKVRVNDETLIKKEIPGPDTVDEFLYEINALSQLYSSHNVIRFYGVIVDDYGEFVKGLLISYAEQGAMIDMIYDHDHSLPWARREKWARQIVEGLSEIHEAGFVQGDFTLSNIVIDHRDNAQIIDINRRGCPVGWEPPEATPLIECNQRISMYIGVKSDLYQLGMVLWALAEQEDEPENQGRPLILGEDLDIPDWYRRVVRICLAENPRARMQAIDLLRLFPPRSEADANMTCEVRPSISVDDGYLVQEFLVNECHTGDGPIIKTVQAPLDWNSRSGFGHTYVESPTGLLGEPYYFPTRGRSPPSPIPSNLDYCESPWKYRVQPWTETRDRSFERTRSSSGFDFAPDAMVPEKESQEMKTQTQHIAAQLGEKMDVEPTPEMTTIGDGSAPPMQEASEEVGQEHEKLSEKTNLGVGRPTEQLNVENVDDSLPSMEPVQATGIQETTDTQNIASKSNEEENQGHNSISSNTKTAPNPLFHEAGTTEPEAPGTDALVPCAAKVQKAKSTSTILDTRQGQEGERIDSAIELSRSSLAPPQLRSVPDALLCMGSRHGSDDDAVRKGSAGTIADDDLVGT